MALRQETELTPRQERALIDRAISGDADAMFELVNRVSFVAHGVARNSLIMFHRHTKGGWSIHAEDLRQEVVGRLFSDGLRILDEFDPNRGALRSFVAKIAKHQILSFLRVQSTTGKNELPSETLPERGHDSLHFARRVLTNLLDRLHADLTADQWNTFVEIFIEGRTSKEAAKSLGTTSTAIDLRVWKIRRRAREHLRQIMKREIGELSSRDALAQWLTLLSKGTES
jgi:RNA polymerase sigma factor (sigma-70 family)